MKVWIVEYYPSPGDYYKGDHFEILGVYVDQETGNRVVEQLAESHPHSDAYCTPYEVRTDTSTETQP